MATLCHNHLRGFRIRKPLTERGYCEKFRQHLVELELAYGVVGNVR